MARTRTSSDWTTTLDSGEQIKTHVAIYGETTYVTVELPNGDIVERRGLIEVERGFRLGGTLGYSVREPILGVEVRSILGDIKVRERSMIKGAEAYGSKVAQVVADQWKAGTL